MTLDLHQLRIEGIYPQKQADMLMLRVKVPAGVISVEQARQVADISERFARGGIHLTSRASIEFHWLKEEDLAEVRRMLSAVGLTSRGACGGAVRGVVCNTPFAASFPALHALVRRLHSHFTGNPDFEGLPKKFKIGVDDGYGEARHLIQDVGLVRAGSAAGQDCYDVWVAGGLGREPVPAFLLERAVVAERLIPLIEAVLRVYREHTPAGKRLKHLVRDIGRDRFLKLLGAGREQKTAFYIPDGFDNSLTALPDPLSTVSLEAGVFAGELTAASLRRLTETADGHGDGFLVLTCDQNVVFHLPEAAAAAAGAAALAEAGFSGASREERVRFRICPGAHECRLGLAPTRTVAREVVATMGRRGEGLSWAIAGCQNSCSQPQLAEVGIIATKLASGADGARLPRFDLYRRSDGEGFGSAVFQGLSLAELLESVRKLD